MSRSAPPSSAQDGEQKATPVVLTALDTAYAEALKVFEIERKNVKSRIAELSQRVEDAKRTVDLTKTESEKVTANSQLEELVHAKRLAELDLEWSFLRNHSKYRRGNNFQVDPSSPISVAMKHDNFVKTKYPLLLSSASRFDVLTDLFGAVSAPITQRHKRRHQLTTSPSRFLNPEVDVEVAYRVPKSIPSKNDPPEPALRVLRIGEKVIFGSVPVESPEVTITTNDERTRYFTLLMLDLDRPNVETKAYEEWCHWLVTDIPVTSHAVLPSFPISNNPAPAPPSFPGNTILPYIPPLPAKQNPRKIRRYTLLVIEQLSPKLDLDFSSVVASAEAARSAVTPSQAAVEGPGELSWQVRERGVVLPLLKFLKGEGAAKLPTGAEMVVKGMALWGAEWDVGLGAVFKTLGLHEPVFANPPKNVEVFLSRVEARQNLLESTRFANPLTSTPSFSDPLLVQRIQSAREERLPPRLITKGAITVKRLKEAEAQPKSSKPAGSKKKEGKASKKAPAPAEPAKKESALQKRVSRRLGDGGIPSGRGRFGVTAAVGLVNLRRRDTLS
ncbi:PEBP-like protein [Gonapodya prolifera JEL478]|uniref:PEBP-like protein n=1 Tax=Gonapodya prolifera (strain JEL478) TaxID=1344416 RepID=A0A139AMD0_GONPJ|nr:PEBP-like protein [Gonapodya prolifera JEL478]|eukprot:KXS17724.1 PEBP-like protein [Gonapodya prolifera JEL478]